MKIYFAFIMFINYLLFSCLILMLAFDVNESQFNLTNSQAIMSAVLSFMFITVSSIELNK